MAKYILPSLALVLLTSVSPVVAFWRMECRATLGDGRVDPLANHGTIAYHAHTLFGAQNINYDSTPDTIRSSSCTSCKVTEDRSNYWTPLLYFMEDDGTTTQVETVGGMLAYYLLNGEDIQAFPAGFQMISGDTNRRNFSLVTPDPEKSLWKGVDVEQSSLAQKAIGYNCLNYNVAPEPSLYRHTLPEKSYMDANCTDGMRLELMFPSCWNGRDVDSPGHKSHVAFPDQVMTGNCPTGFETRLPSLFYETIYDTYAFKDKSGKFVLSNGDPTGTGYHGDFMTGWDKDFLQQAVNTCTNPSGRVEDCPLFAPAIQSDSDAATCKMDMPSEAADENVQGPRQGLPGNVQVVYGPEPAAVNEAGASPGASSAVATTPGHTETAPGYTAATSKITDKFGGGVFVAVSSTTSVSSSTPVASTPTPVASTSTPEPAAPSPSTTPAPAAPKPNENILYTTTYTSDRKEVHLVMIEEDVTVTMPEVATVTTPAQKEKRHAHVHRHLRRHHGGF